MKSIIGKFNDGGPLITVTIFLVLLVIIAMVIIAFINKQEDEKIKSLINHLGWFALAWGYLGRTFGLIMAFDNIAAAGQITPELMAGGLKMALIGPLLGLITFIIARLGLIGLKIMERKKSS